MVDQPAHRLRFTALPVADYESHSMARGRPVVGDYNAIQAGIHTFAATSSIDCFLHQRKFRTKEGSFHAKVRILARKAKLDLCKNQVQLGNADGGSGRSNLTLAQFHRGCNW